MIISISAESIFDKTQYYSVFPKTLSKLRIDYDCPLIILCIQHNLIKIPKTVFLFQFTHLSYYTDLFAYIKES